MPENAPLKPGDSAPEFELMNQDKARIKLSDYRGRKNVMLLFYPMDFSPVCTEEHCSFGPELATLQGKDGDTEVFGVSCDSLYSHAAFRKQYSIPYDLLSDPTRAMVKAYGMWSGLEPYNASKRGTVVIDKEGKIKHYEEVAPREARKVEGLAQAALVEDLLRERDNEGGERGSASR